MRPRNLLPYSIATLTWCAASVSAHHFLDLEVGQVFRSMEATMKVGERFRFKSTSDAARYWKSPHMLRGR